MQSHAGGSEAAGEMKTSLLVESRALHEESIDRVVNQHLSSVAFDHQDVIVEPNDVSISSRISPQRGVGPGAIQRDGLDASPISVESFDSIVDGAMESGQINRPSASSIAEARDDFGKG